MKRNLNQAPARHVLGPIVAAAIAAVSAGCGGSAHAYPDKPVRLIEDVADRQRRLPVDRELPVRRAGLDQRDTHGRIGGQPVGDDAAGRAAPTTM